MSQIRILIGAEGVWKYYSEHQQELEKTTKLMACNDKYDIEIHITDEGGVCNAMVYLENVEVAVKEMCDYPSTKDTMKELYQKYIYGAETFIKERQQEIDESDEEEMIFDRESELDDAVYDMLSVFCGSAFDPCSDETLEIFEDVKDTICELLFEKHGIEIYRPMYIADEDEENIEFCLYPYAELVG